MPWWKFWDPNKKPGKGQPKSTGGGKAGSGRVADSPTYKKNIVRGDHRKFDGRAN